MQRLKVIIYDCDGVLFDSKRANEAFYNHILNRFGMPPLEPAQLEYVHSSTAIEAIDCLFQSSPLREDAHAYRQATDYRPFIPLMKIEPYVREVLERLRPNYRTAVATNRSNTMPLVLRDHGLETLFDMIVTSMDVSEPKPHPESLWKILRHFDAKPDKALYIGDTEVDRITSGRAGIMFAAYRNHNLEADYHLQHHLDLLKILDLQPSSG